MLIFKQTVCCIFYLFQKAVNRVFFLLFFNQKDRATFVPLFRGTMSDTIAFKMIEKEN